MVCRAWWLSGLNNFGDQLTPWLVEQVTGEPAQYCEIDEPRRKLIGAGSVVTRARSGSVVWGAGALSLRESVAPNADYRAVRGPKTRKMVLEQGGHCPEVYGDPGLLVPWWVDASPKQWTLGIVPHFMDYEQASHEYPEGVEFTIIDVRAEVEQVARRISSCEVIASSSLHGLVLACAYGIPHVQLVFGARLAGDGIKFADFYDGIGYEPAPVLRADEEGFISPEEMLRVAAQAGPLDLSDLWHACPIAELNEAGTIAPMVPPYAVRTN